MASRLDNFGAAGIQALHHVLSELGRSASIQTRQEISDLLLVLGGHLFATNFYNRWFAWRAVEAAFRLKCEIAATEKSPTMDGYAAAIHTLCSLHLPSPVTEEQATPLQLAHYLPGRIHRAFLIVEPSKMIASNLCEMQVDLPESDKPAFEQARENAIIAAKALLDVAVTDPDGILAPYLKGLPPIPERRQRPALRPSCQLCREADAGAARPVQGGCSK